MLDPRPPLAKPLKVDHVEGICVSSRRECSGNDGESECREKEYCVAEAQCRGRLSRECKGVCVQLLGPTWGSVNGTEAVRRAAANRMC